MAMYELGEEFLTWSCAGLESLMPDVSLVDRKGRVYTHAGYVMHGERLLKQWHDEARSAQLGKRIIKASHQLCKRRQYRLAYNDAISRR